MLYNTYGFCADGPPGGISQPLAALQLLTCNTRQAKGKLLLRSERDLASERGGGGVEHENSMQQKGKECRHVYY